ncbi:hypothetical protein, partial [Bacillus thuringiensis]|uniref:hypothetical protein n=1 Tax=Bacillus thuringiensis TaxID=1428 RepID=UPI0011A4B182
MNKKEIWGKMRGNEMKKLERGESRKVELYFEMLLNGGGLIRLEGKESGMIMEGELGLVSGGRKDRGWYESVELVFSIRERGNDLGGKDKTTKK